MAELLVAPEVSRTKFDREVSRYVANSREYRERGWLLLRAEFPDFEVAFAAPHLWPHPLLFAVRVNYSNHDLWAPSVRFIDPFDGHALTLAEVRKKRISLPQVQGANLVFGPNGTIQVPMATDLVQGDDENDLAFICLPGIREYHEHPAHSADPWLAHRKDGIGSLHNILDKLHNHGVLSVRSFGFNINIAITDIQRLVSA